MSDIEAQINVLQEEIRDRLKELKALRQNLNPESVKNYLLKDRDGNPVSLLEMFGDSDELLLIHNMGKECRYCTMWADGFRGLTEIIADRMPWVLVSPNEVDDLKKFADGRNWNFNVFSCAQTTFAQDLGFAELKNEKMFYKPGVSALIRKGSEIFRVAKDGFGPGDLYNPAWHFFDLFPKSVNGWYPKYDYKKGE